MPPQISKKESEKKEAAPAKPKEKPKKDSKKNNKAPTELTYDELLKKYDGDVHTQVFQNTQIGLPNDGTQNNCFMNVCVQALAVLKCTYQPLVNLRAVKNDYKFNVT